MKACSLLVLPGEQSGYFPLIMKSWQSTYNEPDD